VSKFDLRDISERLTNSSDTEAVVFEFLGYLQSLHSDWRASLAFYEVSRDALENVYERQGGRLVRRDVTVSVDQLPARLVRKFFHPSAFFNQGNRRSMLSQLLRTSPVYEPSQVEAAALRQLVPVASWQSCVCVSLLDREDVLAMLVIASEKRNALPSKSVDEILPVKSIAALALAQQLHRAGWSPEKQNGAGDARAAAAEFQEKIRELTDQAVELEQDNKHKSQKLEKLALEIETLDKNSSEYKGELERVKGTIMALEEQSSVATQHLNEAYTQLTAAQQMAGDLARTVEFMRDVCRMVSEPHEHEEFAQVMMNWLCEQVGVERCSMMTLDPTGDTLHITAQCGMDPEVVGRVKVRVGQGIAGWVANNRRPLFVRVPEESQSMQRNVQETYNSDSFICVPLLHDGDLFGVLNLSNKREGEAFEAIDLDRATMAAAVLAVVWARGAALDAASRNGNHVAEPGRVESVA
jgi:transcriptional regulator with GAF, ATPase, and Fis domain